MLFVALVHYPTVNKEGKVVTTSVTNFDIHDIARASRTFGVERYFIVTPIEAQQAFTRRILGHWVEGAGADYNPTRKDALEGVEVVGDLAAVGEAIQRDYGGAVHYVATSAIHYANHLPCREMRKRLDAAPETGEKFCLIFGTGSGLHPEVIEQCDYLLESIYGPGPWNHLSVRSAVSIYLDRLRGNRDD